MEDDLFDTPEKREEAVMLFRSLMENQGWQLVVKIVKKNIEVLNKQLAEGMEGETLETVKEIRNKIKIHENIINTPIDMINSFTGEGTKEVEFDPYPQTLKESRE